MADVDRCVVCGQPIPEGLQLCHTCKKNGRRRHTRFNRRARSGKGYQEILQQQKQQSRNRLYRMPDKRYLLQRTVFVGGLANAA